MLGNQQWKPVFTFFGPFVRNLGELAGNAMNLHNTIQVLTDRFGPPKSVIVEARNDPGNLPENQKSKNQKLLRNYGKRLVCIVVLINGINRLIRCINLL